NSASEGIFGLNSQGSHTFVNPAAAGMLGYSIDELLGRCSHPIWHHTKADGSPYPEEECPIYGSYHKGVAHDRVRDEVFWRKDGISFPVSYTSTPIIENSEITGAVVSFIDITERRQAEDALLLSEARYRRITEGLTDYQYTVRIENGRAVETKHSPACAAVTGYTAEEFAADPYLWINMVVPEDRELTINRVEQILESNDILPIEHR